MTTALHRIRRLLLVTVTLVAVMAPMQSASAAEYVVDTVSNAPGTFACTAAPDDCGIIGAVEAANIAAGPDRITFDIPAGQCPGGVCPIALTEPVEVFDQVEIDATTQPRGAGPQANVCSTATSDSFMRVEISVDDNPAFTLGASGVTINGFAIVSAPGSATGSGILVLNADDHHIACNHIGLDASGTKTASILQYGINAGGMSGATIGTNGDGVADVGERNLFGPADEYALRLDVATENTIAGNVFGAAGDPANPDYSVLGLGDATFNVVGTNEDGVSDELERNYFAGTSAIDMFVLTDTIDGNRIVGNSIGFTPAGEPVDALSGIYIIEPRPWDDSIEIRNNTFGPVGVGTLIDGDADVLISGNTYGGAGYDSKLPLWLIGAGNHTVADNLFRNATETALVLDGSVTLAGGSTGNCLVGNSFAVDNSTGSAVTFEDNWWGDKTGPSGEGPGSGDPVGVDVDFSPWLESPPELCNEAPVAGDLAFTIAEGTPIGTTVGTVVATDDGVAPLTFSITGGNTGGAFAIDSGSGQLTVATALNAATKATYELTVAVADPFATGTATVTIDVLAGDSRFDDVAASHLFYREIQWLAGEDITRGCNPPDNTLFCPDASVTRGQMAAFLHRALGDDLVPGTPATFTDIAGSVFAGDIEWLGAVGVTKGCNPPANDLFCPNDVVTRGQMAAFLVRALGYSEGAGSDQFTDDDGSVFEADIERLAAAGITKGCNPPANDLFCPDDPVTRGQMAAFLFRALGS